MDARRNRIRHMPYREADLVPIINAKGGVLTMCPYGGPVEQLLPQRRVRAIVRTTRHSIGYHPLTKIVGLEP